jgi:hypothetical protein
VIISYIQGMIFSSLAVTWILTCSSVYTLPRGEEVMMLDLE